MQKLMEKLKALLALLRAKLLGLLHHDASASAPAEAPAPAPAEAPAPTDAPKP